ncbi:hypothetical protein BJ742DRAFT_735478 [Cladochytrium replicatum]|nr:hypothetical protein BJ742DRAFT_735478 [Cladochytrium replicatum]
MSTAAVIRILGGASIVVAVLVVGFQVAHYYRPEWFSGPSNHSSRRRSPSPTHNGDDSRINMDELDGDGLRRRRGGGSNYDENARAPSTAVDAADAARVAELLRDEAKLLSLERELAERRARLAKEEADIGWKQEQLDRAAVTAQTAQAGTSSKLTSDALLFSAEDNDLTGTAAFNGTAHRDGLFGLQPEDIDVFPAHDDTDASSTDSRFPPQSESLLSVDPVSESSLDQIVVACCLSLPGDSFCFLEPSGNQQQIACSDLCNTPSFFAKWWPPISVKFVLREKGNWIKPKIGSTLHEVNSM